MEDKSFVNLLRQENLERIDIDSRLIDSFKRVMIKIQAYFNANGYTSERNYTEFFEEYLLKDAPDKLKLVVNRESSKRGIVGFYQYNEKEKLIAIDELCFNYDEEYVDSVLCHEFIHFLVTGGLDKADFPDPEIKNGGFIDEALTEMLNQQMYPNSPGYKPQVDMLKFANLLTGNVNNYSLFLRGNIDSKGGASSWVNFCNYANAYHKKYADKGYLMKQAINDYDYINAQQCIISANVHPHLISSFEEYKKWVSILHQRPASDNEYMNKFFIEMDNYLIQKLGLKNSKLQNVMLQQLSEYRQIPFELLKYDGKDVYEFEISGHKVAIDKDANLYKNELGAYASSWNPNTGIYQINVGNEIIKLDVNNIDFGKRKKELSNRKQTIEKYFSSTSQKDLKAVMDVVKTEGLVKLEKFILPNIGVNGANSVAYLATYNDRIEILNNPLFIGVEQNINLSEYQGLTSSNPKNALIVAKTLGSIDKGYVYSNFNEKTLHSKAIKLLKDEIASTLTSEQMQKIIEQYKKSEEFDPEDDLNNKKLLEFAVQYYAKNQYYQLPDEERKKLYECVVNSSNKHILYNKNNKIHVALFFGDKVKSAYEANSEVLIDIKGNGLYNEHFKLLKENEYDLSKLEIDENGRLIFLQNENQRLSKMKKEMVDQQSIVDKTQVNEYYQNKVR